MSRQISLCLILLTNALFVYKYGGRATGQGVLLSVVYLLFGAFVARYRGNKVFARTRVQKWLVASVAVLVVLAVGVEFYIPLDGLNVDRWSVISSFLDALVSGEYPYFAESHMGNPPGPMPIYFLIAAPFYWLEQLSILSVLGYIIAAWWVAAKSTSPVFGLLLLFCSPFLSGNGNA